LLTKIQRGRKKRAIRHEVGKAREGTVILFGDSTLLREFPPLRACWAKVGEQAQGPITGNNARRALFATLNPRTGHLVRAVLPDMKKESFHVFLKMLRKHYRRPIWLLVDRHSAHRAAKRRGWAKGLKIRLIWLPVACPEDNPLENIWRIMKGEVAANRCYGDIEELCRRACEWLDSLSAKEALERSGISSNNFWLYT
jgi:transposase